MTPAQEEFLRLRRVRGWRAQFNSLAHPVEERWRVVDHENNIVAYGRNPAAAYKAAWRKEEK